VPPPDDASPTWPCLTARIDPKPQRLPRSAVRTSGANAADANLAFHSGNLITCKSYGGVR